MSNPTHPVYNPGDLVRVEDEDLGIGPEEVNEYYAIVVAQPERHPVMMLDSWDKKLRDYIWVRPVENPDRLYCSVPDVVALVQRGEQ